MAKLIIVPLKIAIFFSDDRQSETNNSIILDECNEWNIELFYSSSLLCGMYVVCTTYMESRFHHFFDRYNLEIRYVIVHAISYGTIREISNWCCLVKLIVEKLDLQ